MTRGKRPAALATPVHLVCATRTGPGGFGQTHLGRSLALWHDDRREIDPFAATDVGTTVYYNNTHGLPDVYNEALTGLLSTDGVIVFLHDDVYVADFNWPSLVSQGLERFDIVGVAGSARLFPGQEAWYLDENSRIGSPEFLSGTVSHGEPANCHLMRYGYAPRRCLLLDGLFLAVKSATLARHGLRFDPRFRFHCYDMDFCRQATACGLTLGTIRLSLIHGSGGYSVNSPDFDGALRQYRAKWEDR